MTELTREEKKYTKEEIKSKINSFDAFVISALNSYIRLINKDRSPIQSMIDESTGFHGITDADALEFLEGSYGEMGVPDYMEQLVKEIFGSSLLRTKDPGQN